METLNDFLLIHCVSTLYRTNDISMVSDVINLRLNISDIAESQALTANHPTTGERGEQGEEIEKERKRSAPDHRPAPSSVSMAINWYRQQAFNEPLIYQLDSNTPLQISIYPANLLAVNGRRERDF